MKKEKVINGYTQQLGNTDFEFRTLSERYGNGGFLFKESRERRKTVKGIGEVETILVKVTSMSEYVDLDISLTKDENGDNERVLKTLQPMVSQIDFEDVVIGFWASGNAGSNNNVFTSLNQTIKAEKVKVLNQQQPKPNNQKQ